MTVAEWCVFGAVILYLLTIAPFKAIGFRSFDNAARAIPNSTTNRCAPARSGHT